MTLNNGLGKGKPQPDSLCIKGMFAAIKAFKDILKDGELEDNWNTWVEEKMAVVQPVLDQLNK